MLISIILEGIDKGVNPPPFQQILHFTPLSSIIIIQPLLYQIDMKWRKVTLILSEVEFVAPHCRPSHFYL